MSESKKKNVLLNNPVVNVFRSNIGIVMVLIIMCVIISFATDKFLTPTNIISVLRQISINTYIALGMTLVIILGHIDLSVGAIVAMSGTLTVGFIVNQGLPIWLAIVLGIVLGAVTGLPVVYMVVLIAIFAFLLNKTKFGTYIYAIGGNREAARLSGVPIKKVEIVVFTLSGLLSAFAGLVLCSRMYSGQPSVGSGYELDAIAACVLGGTSMAGGKGRISGTVFGAIVIGIISNGLNLIGVSSYWQLIIKGLIIACAVLLDVQKGKLGKLKKKKVEK